MDHKRRKLIKTGIQAGAHISISRPSLFLMCTKRRNSQSKGNRSTEETEHPHSRRHQLPWTTPGGLCIGKRPYAFQHSHVEKPKPTVHQEMFEQVESLVGDRENDLEVTQKPEMGCSHR